MALVELDINSFEEMFQMNKLPKPKVLSSKVTIKFAVQNFGLGDFVYPGDAEIPVGEFDDFSVQKSFTVVKRWKPFGSKFEKVLVEDNGWDISFSGGKIDWNLAYLFYTNEKLLSGEDTSNLHGKSNTFANIGVFYSQPMFSIEHSITHYDGKVETYIYKDVQLLSYSQDVSGNNGIVKESATAFSPMRVEGANLKEIDKTKINNRVIHTIAAMVSLNRS